MGYLSDGRTLKWPDSKKYLKKIKQEGIKQYLKLYKKTDKNIIYPFKFGDEIEYTIYSIDKEKKIISIALVAHIIIDQLNNDEKNTKFSWHPEYADYMIEGLPKNPYNDSILDLLNIEPDLNQRQQFLIDCCLDKNYVVGMITCFPRLGCEDSCPLLLEYQQYSESNILSDSIIGNHIRFHTLTENIRLRRGSKVNINIPIYKDIMTNPLLNQIEMDCMAFGMGCSCLQETMQMANEKDARYLYDQLAVLSPIMLCLTAASPVYKGFLSDNDCRWDLISMAVDDRTPEEYITIKKSRYSSINQYVGNNELFKEIYNDIDQSIDNEINQLLENEVDDCLKKHLNYLFIRDPLVIYEKEILEENADENGILEGGKILEENEKEKENEILEGGKILDENENENNLNKYENIHSTNWNTVRLKIPISNQCGWRVEFRPMELQSNDFSNSSFLIFINLLSRAIIKYSPDWYIPISLIDINMSRAQKRNAISNQLFYFKDSNQKISEKNINTIIDELMVLVINYLHEMVGTIKQKNMIMNYLDYISKRASCQIPTDATIIREYILNHSDYKFDSYVSNEICYDLMMKYFIK